MAELFPIFLKLNGRKALVIGGGKMAAMRTKQLLNAGAKVRVVSPKAGSEIERLAKAKSVVLVRRGFRIPGDLATQKKLVDDFVERVLKNRRVRQSPQARAL